jgi:glutathione S-transferase
VSDALVLHMFAASHFNEKARWALDWKGLAHRRIAYLPCSHRLPIQRLSGQSQTPVLEMEAAVIAGSAQIIDALERTHPEPALFPRIRSRGSARSAPRGGSRRARAAAAEAAVRER